MYKAAQDKGDWINRVGSHATRPVLHAHVDPRPVARFHTGRLAELIDERKRLIARLPNKRTQHIVGARLGVINEEIKRLNREAAEASEMQLLWKAIHQTFSEEEVARLSRVFQTLRMVAEGHSTAEIIASFPHPTRLASDSDRSGEAGETGETGTGSTEGESAGRSDSEGIAQSPEQSS